MQLYTDVLKKGWQVSTKHPWLWFFGLFALLLNGNGGEYNFYLRQVNYLVGRNSVFSPSFWQGKEWQSIIDKLENFWAASPAITIILSVVLVLALVIVVYFVIISQAALIKAAHQSETSKPDFKKTFSAVNKNFWAVFAVNLLAKLSIFLVLILLAVPFLNLILDTNNEYYNSLYFVVGLLILVPLVLIVSFVTKYAVNYIVIEQQKIGVAIKKAFVLFYNNWLVSLEMALIIFILSIALGVFLLLASAILLAPFLASSVATVHDGSLAGVFTIMFIGVIIAIIALAVGAAIFSSWQWTSWTFLFKELTKGPKQGKLIRVFQKKE